ncbi:unnamed protein product, partial [Mesorhabditis belari]|uniref:Golgi apparatus protein 1 n=1 Tax=Mesorhabditis belari TaxID=2138241 RepID=A0AAF3FG42_9BILA
MKRLWLVAAAFLVQSFVTADEAAPAGNNNVNVEAGKNGEHIIDFDACKEDIHKYCNHDGVDLKSDISIIECLQDAGQKETGTLTKACETLVWDFKKRLTQDERFLGAAKQYCEKEMKERPAMAHCAQETEPGYALSCMIEFVANVTQESQCYQFLFRTERLAFSDFRLVAPFIKKCESELKSFNCQVMTPDKAHKGVAVPHTQGMALECLIQQLVKEGNKQGGPVQIGDTCKHEVMRLAEMQADDFHLDRPLFFACRQDREKFCRDVPAGQGKVFECLIVNRNKAEMQPECSKILVERAQLMGRDYRMAHPLSKACAADLKKYNCEAQNNLDAAVHFHMTWILLCLENGAKTQEKNPPSQECQHEMLSHRQMMMTEFRIAPEVVLNCANEIDQWCSPKGDIEAQGRTLHCLMAHAKERKDKEKFGAQCMQALGEVVKIADIGSNYKVDKVLFASCKDIIEGPCQQDAESEAATLQCLMKNVDSDKMTPQCEQRLIEVQYFMARDWTLDPRLYQACHQDAVSKCSALENWHMQTNDANKVDPGPQVLACLYRSAYDETNPLTPQCTQEVRRVLRERAIRVSLIPEVEENCRGALSEYCSHNIQPQEEMQCLQDHFEEKDFIKHHKPCYDEVKKFTEMEAKDTKLNRLLTRACKPVIEAHCEQFKNEEIDHGDVLECLVQHKDSDHMNSKCRSYVHHFELISLRDYHFSFKFQQSCGPDIQKHCSREGNEKASIIRCLSEVQFLHRVLGQSDDLAKDCKKQLRVAYLEQEQVETQFDDKENMKEADPNLWRKCESDIKRLGCKDENTFEEVIECLREGFDSLVPDCKALVFDREKFEAADNTLDDELQRLCAPDIQSHCRNVQPDRVLDCLTNTKILRMLKKPCLKVVHERMKEQAKDVRLRPAFLTACRKEAETFCTEDMKKINDERYAKTTLEGVVVNCLREQFRKGFGGSKAHFSQECTIEMSNMILESEFDVQLDPPLYKACKNAIDRHCTSQILSKGGHYDNVIECLKADFFQGAIQDKSCNEELAKRTQESLVDIHLDPVLHESCANDIQRHCRDVPPGEGRVIKCLMDLREISSIKMNPECATKLHERHQLWQKAHAEYQMALPETFGELIDVIRDHPNKTSLLSWFALFIVVILLLGCCCGRATKRVARELKNR